MKYNLPGFQYKVWLPAALLSALAFSGCFLAGDDEGVPAYIHIPSFKLETQPGTQGSAAQKITDVWVSVNDRFLGVYPLPATVPVLESGQVDVLLEAGIKDNGINATSVSYPFYRIYETSADLEIGEVDTLRPVVTYLSGLKFAAIEDFESSNLLFNKLLNSGGDGLVRTTGDVFEGDYSGLIRLDKDHPVQEITTTRLFKDLTTVSPVVYLEVSYKAEAPVIFGVIGYGSGLSTPILDPGFAPKDTWNKIYFNLSSLLTDPQYTDGYQLVMQAFIPQVNGQLEMDSAKVWLDNIKLLHL